MEDAAGCQDARRHPRRFLPRYGIATCRTREVLISLSLTGFHFLCDCFLSDGVRQCSDEHASDSERTLACLPLHTNLIFLYKLLQR